MLGGCKRTVFTRGCSQKRQDLLVLFVCCFCLFVFTSNKHYLRKFAHLFPQKKSEEASRADGTRAEAPVTQTGFPSFPRTCQRSTPAARRKQPCPSWLLNYRQPQGHLLLFLTFHPNKVDKHGKRGNEGCNKRKTCGCIGAAHHFLGSPCEL